MNSAELTVATQAALNGDWHTAHNITQKHSDTAANWLHAVLHKIEGDKWSSRYWYARTAGKSYEDFRDANAELTATYEQLVLSAQLIIL